MNKLLDATRIKNQLIKAFGISKKEAKIILTKSNDDLKKLRLVSPIDFLLYFDSVLPKDEKTLRTLFYISTLESIIAVKKSHKQKIKLVSDAIIKHLSEDEKLKLLGGFIFSKTYLFGSGKLGLRHLMIKDVMKDKKFNRYGYIESQTRYCSTGHPNYLCRCVEWLKETKSYDKYIPELVKSFSEMRGAMLHEAFPVLWFPDYKHDPKVAIYSSALVDAHPTHNHPLIFKSYESGIDSEEFYKWIKKIILEYLRNT